MTFPKSGHGHSVAIMEITLSVYKVDQLFDLQKFGKKCYSVLWSKVMGFLFLLL